MTDNEIITALEEWIKNYDGSYVNFKTLGNALDLINRQKAEIERLRKEVKEHIKKSVAKRRYDRALIKAEAYKEFAERLKRNEGRRGVPIGTIDNLVKEMVGENE